MIDTKENAPAATEAARQKQHNANISIRRPTKKARVLLALKSRGGINRFEAEHLGDHCLNSTVATLRREGWHIVSHWEKAPSRFTQNGVRVKRYRLGGDV